MKLIEVRGKDSDYGMDGLYEIGDWGLGIIDWKRVSIFFVPSGFPGQESNAPSSVEYLLWGPKYAYAAISLPQKKEKKKKEISSLHTSLLLGYII